MAHLLNQLISKQLIKPPKWLPDNLVYLGVVGSVAYGTAAEDADWDMYGICVPPKEMVFPHLAGDILGFGRQKKRFEQWSQHHIVDPDAVGGRGREYDFTVYNIVKYFQLAMEATPNIIDSLFVPRTCVIYINRIGEIIRDNRRLFLSKKCKYTMIGYAMSQLHKMNQKGHKHLEELKAFESDHQIPHSTKFAEVERAYKKRKVGCEDLAWLTDKELEDYYLIYKKAYSASKRVQIVKHLGFDGKFAAHAVRLVDQGEQVLTTGDLDLQRSKETQKAIRRGELDADYVRQYVQGAEARMEKLYENSSLPHAPDEDAIKAVLLQCLEEQYGSIQKAVVIPDAPIRVLREITALIDSNRSLIGE